MIIRQGDVTLVRKGNAPKTSEKPKTVILAKGEESGHWHAATGIIDRIVEGRRTIIVPEPTTMVVEPASHANRHEPVEIPAGEYEVLGVPDNASIWLGQREYTPEIVRAVGD